MGFLAENDMAHHAAMTALSSSILHIMFIESDIMSHRLCILFNSAAVALTDTRENGVIEYSDEMMPRKPGCHT